MNRVLCFGAGGQLAGQLIRLAPPEKEWVALARAQADITDAAQVAAAIETARPDLVLNGAAYNAVDRAEGDGLEAAIGINALGAGVLARACREANVPLAHFSTDFVFDGAQRIPYRETDATGPLNAYGASKLAGENLVLAASPRNFVIRVCRLFGPASAHSAPAASGFPALMLRLARERGRVRVVRGQVGAPGYTPDLARGVWQLLENSTGGLYQLCNAGEVAFDEYARSVFEMAGVSCEVESVSSEEYGAAARRPEYSVLCNEKAHDAGVTPLRYWREALREFLEEWTPAPGSGA
jgi:dTDP-4-dehydrorhamnose reductase